jgi:AraC family transcriptional regulator, transcriptional activator FtrA
MLNKVRKNDQYEIAEEFLYLHSDSPDRFVFEAPLEDLAKQEDLLTAKYGTK